MVNTKDSWGFTMGYYKKALDSYDYQQQMGVDEAIVNGYVPKDDWNTATDSKLNWYWYNTNVQGTTPEGKRGTLWWGMRRGLATDHVISDHTPTRAPFHPGDDLINEVLASKNRRD